MNARRFPIAGILVVCMSASIAAAADAADDAYPSSEAQQRDAIKDAPVVTSGGFEELFVEIVHDAHGYEAWTKLADQVLRARISMKRELAELSLDAVLWYEIDGGRFRIERKDDLIAGHDEDGFWMMQHDEASPRALRQHLASLPYLLVMPFRLLEENNLLRGRTVVDVHGRRHYGTVVNITRDREAARHHWYIAFVHGRSGLLGVMAYYCDPDHARPAGKREPMAIAYHDYETIDGVKLATRWTFHGWDDENGIKSDIIGNARLREIAFVNADEATFERPTDAVCIDPVPEAEDDENEANDDDEAADTSDEMSEETSGAR